MQGPRSFHAECARHAVEDARIDAVESTHDEPTLPFRDTRDLCLQPTGVDAKPRTGLSSPDVTLGTW
jgi:hypothetical protein